MIGQCRPCVLLWTSLRLNDEFHFSRAQDSRATEGQKWSILAHVSTFRSKQMESSYQKIGGEESAWASTVHYSHSSPNYLRIKITLTLVIKQIPRLPTQTNRFRM